MTLVFPSILMLCDFGAAVVYALDGDWRRCIYWLSALALTACVSI